MRPVWIAICIIVMFITVPPGAVTTTGLPGKFCIVGGRWDKLSVDQDIAIYKQRSLESGLLAFRAEGVLNAPIDQVMEVLRRVEFTNEWMPDVGDKFLLEEVSDIEAITYSLNKVPFPFADRELVLGRFKL